jgi:glycine/D-amino acid oxidase-like deaminating enzyme
MSGGWTRRECLALAGAAAGLGCRRRPELTIPPGEIAGAGAARGHRLRDRGELALPKDAPRWTTEVAIVGAGAAGLCAAWRLIGGGVDELLVVELEDAAGGTARSGRFGELAFPWGAHYVAVPRRDQPAMVRLLSELGAFEGEDAAGEPIAAEALLVRDPEERLYHRGRWTEGLLLPGGDAEDRRQLRAFEAEVARWAEARDSRGRRAFTLPVSRCSDDAEVAALDRITMAEWMAQRGLVGARLRWWVDYACRDDYGATAAQISAWAGLFYFASRMFRGASAPLITWPEGNGRLIAHLLQVVLQRKERLRTGWTALSVRPQAGGVEVILADPGGTLAAIEAQKVILATPVRISGALFEPWRREPPPHLEHFRSGAWLVANLLLRDRPVVRGFPLAWDNVIYDGRGLGYVVSTHQQGRDRGPTVFSYYLPLLDDDPREARRALEAMSHQDGARLVLQDLVRAHPDLPPLVERLDWIRWGHAMIRPVPGLTFGPARKAAAAPRGGVHFAHSDLSGVALFEEALDQGVRAAEEILVDLGRGAESWR